MINKINTAAEGGYYDFGKLKPIRKCIKVHIQIVYLSLLNN